jgi:hypothetical protein
MNKHKWVAVSTAVFVALSAVGAAAPAKAQTIAEKREERIKARQATDPVTRTGEVSTPRETFSRKTEGDVDTENGRAYRSRTATGPEGQTGSVAGEVNRIDTGYTATQAVTDKDGQTAGRTVTQSAEEGRLTRERSAYSRNGETATSSDTIQRTDNGATRSQSVATSTGRGGAVNSEVQRQDDGANLSRTATNAQGETVATKNSSITKTEDGLSRKTTATNKDGKHFERSKSVTKKD